MEEVYNKMVHLAEVLANHITYQRKPKVELISEYIDLCEEIRMWNTEFELHQRED